MKPQGDSAPASEKVMGVSPEAVSSRLPNVPLDTVKVFALVITGASEGGVGVTVNIKFCGSELPAALLAMMVKLCVPTVTVSDI